MGMLMITIFNLVVTLRQALVTRYQIVVKRTPGEDVIWTERFYVMCGSEVEEQGLKESGD